MAWPVPITAITLFTDDLAASRAFYTEVFALPVHWEDEVSCVFEVGGVLVNLLETPEAEDLIAPIVPGGAGTAPRIQLTLTVDDVDAVAAQLVVRGGALVNGPIDRPWGIRTALVADPSGHLWELAK